MTKLEFVTWPTRLPPTGAASKPISALPSRDNLKETTLWITLYNSSSSDPTTSFDTRFHSIKRIRHLSASRMGIVGESRGARLNDDEKMNV